MDNSSLGKLLNPFLLGVLLNTQEISLVVSRI